MISRWKAIAALAAAVVVSGALELLFLDRDHFVPTVWGASIPLDWAGIGLAGVALTAAAAWALGRTSLLRERDPYDGEDADG